MPSFAIPSTGEFVRFVKLLCLATPLMLGACVDSGPKAASDGRRLFVGESTACALDRDGAVWCWGRNSEYFEYGVNPSVLAPSSTPVAVPVPRLMSLAGGPSSHVCGLREGGEAICWGRGGVGQLGSGSTSLTGNAPATVLFSGTMTDIRVGRLTTCGLVAPGDAYCWGLNQSGELGDTLVGAGEQVQQPNKVVGGVTFSSVVPGWTHTCGVSTAGAIYCWGDNTRGQLGIGTIDDDDHPRPLLVPYPAAFRSVALSARSTCALTTDDRILCWGYNGAGQLGDGTTTSRAEPAPIASDLKFREVAVSSGFGGAPAIGLVNPTGLTQGGIAHACGVTDTGIVFCWGWNGNGQLGDGTTTQRLSPTLVPGLNGVTSIALGGAFSCATTENALACWGYNYFGQLGDGKPTIDSPVPVTVNFPWP
jgi:alpha-tubulin suppressor-like RCC1 family protein